MLSFCLNHNTYSFDVILVLQSKITEKEHQIEEVSRKIDAITKELQAKGQKTPGTGNGSGKKAVRIQEPEVIGGHSHLDIVHIDPVSDYTSTSATKTSQLSDFESSFI